MTNAEREQQILRVKQHGYHTKLDATLEEHLRIEVVATVKAVLESALREEVSSFLEQVEGEKPHRSGYYRRSVNTQYGHINELKVPKLRQRNR